ncbi:hypothetical protein D9M68_665320 [compost metagenome]
MVRIASITCAGFMAWKKLPDCTSTITAAGKVKDMMNSPTVPSTGSYQASQPMSIVCTSEMAKSFHGR